MKRSRHCTADRGRGGIPAALLRGWTSFLEPADCGRKWELGELPDTGPGRIWSQLMALESEREEFALELTFAGSCIGSMLGVPGSRGGRGGRPRGSQLDARASGRDEPGPCGQGA